MRIPPMSVSFRRTGPRAYAVEVRRQGHATFVMDPAPGFDPLVPHDLLHLVVEDELALRGGIFGQLAQGGTAGTFFARPGATFDHPSATPARVNSKAHRRTQARERRRTARRGRALLSQGRDDAACSERATFLCMYEWLARSGDPQRRARAAAMREDAQHIRQLQAEHERKALDTNALARVCARLDTSSLQWASLYVGECLVVEWPGEGRRVRRTDRVPPEGRHLRRTER
jgi:hypothetical protein